MTDQIYVELLEEGLQVWRPVSARYIVDNIYEIIDDGSHDSKHETWMFLPGSRVVCVLRHFDDSDQMVAVARAESLTPA